MIFCFVFLFPAVLSQSLYQITATTEQNPVTVSSGEVVTNAFWLSPGRWVYTTGPASAPCLQVKFYPTTAFNPIANNFYQVKEWIRIPSGVGATVRQCTSGAPDPSKQTKFLRISVDLSSIYFADLYNTPFDELRPSASFINGDLFLVKDNQPVNTGLQVLRYSNIEANSAVTPDISNLLNNGLPPSPGIQFLHAAKSNVSNRTLAFTNCATFTTGSAEISSSLRECGFPSLNLNGENVAAVFNGTGICSSFGRVFPLNHTTVVLTSGSAYVVEDTISYPGKAFALSGNPAEYYKGPGLDDFLYRSTFVPFGANQVNFRMEKFSIYSPEPLNIFSSSTQVRGSSSMSAAGTSSTSTTTTSTNTVVSSSNWITLPTTTTTSSATSTSLTTTSITFATTTSTSTAAPSVLSSVTSQFLISALLVSARSSLTSVESSSSDGNTFISSSSRAPPIEILSTSPTVSLHGSVSVSSVLKSAESVPTLSTATEGSSMPPSTSPPVLSSFTTVSSAEVITSTDGAITSEDFVKVSLKISSESSTKVSVGGGSGQVGENKSGLIGTLGPSLYYLVFIFALLVLAVITMFGIRRLRKDPLAGKPTNSAAKLYADESGGMVTQNFTMTATSMGTTTFGNTTMNFGNGATTMIANGKSLSVPGYMTLVPQSDYIITGQLAEGGGGTVYYGNLLQPNAMNRIQSNQCVVKILKLPDANYIEDMRTSFMQEVAMMALFENNYFIVQMAGYTADPMSIIMKAYLKGSLYDLIFKNANLPDQWENIAAVCGSEIAKGIAEIHDIGVVHHDIKPANVLLDPVPGNPYHVVICDFGIASAVEESLMAVKRMKMSKIQGVSLVYAGPEVITAIEGGSASKDRDILKAGDTFAYAITLYETLFRLPPYPNQNQARIVYSIKNNIRPVIPSGHKRSNQRFNLLIDVMAECWNADPLQRPSMRAVASRL